MLCKADRHHCCTRLPPAHPCIRAEGVQSLPFASEMAAMLLHWHRRWAELQQGLLRPPCTSPEVRPRLKSHYNGIVGGPGQRTG